MDMDMHTRRAFFVFLYLIIRIRSALTLYLVAVKDLVKHVTQS